MSSFPSVPYYQVTRLIQKGGTSAVYEGIDLRNGSVVAIKALYSDKSRDEFMLRRFKEEANHYLLLSHPNIPRLVDFVEHEGRMFLIMEYVDGIDMSQYLKRHGPLDANLVIHFFTMLLDTIQYLHEHEILHLDIKPANIMITDDWGIKVLDLGISAIVSEGETRKKRCGSPSFMAPEQIRNEKLGYYTDIYQIGATLFNMITGYPPYVGNTRQEIFDHICHMASPVLQDLVSPDLQPLQSVIDKSMHKDGDQRYHSCKEMEESLLSCFLAMVEAEPESESKSHLHSINEQNNTNMRIITIGREIGNDIVIDDNRVSRHHLEIIQDDANNFFVRDLNSTNGTFVNGNRIVGEKAIETTDVIRIGNTTLPWISYFSTPDHTEMELDAPSPKSRRRGKVARESDGEPSKFKKGMKSVGKWFGRTALALLTSLLMMLMFRWIMKNF